MYEYDPSMELHHHGIKGQRRGVRRYQNSDGSLTDEGRRRYGFGKGARRLITKNTTDRMKGGTVLGAKIGAGIGAGVTFEMRDLNRKTPVNRGSNVSIVR